MHILKVVLHIVNFDRQCHIQTKRRARMPIFLVVRQFWQPILDGLQEALLKELNRLFVSNLFASTLCFFKIGLTIIALLPRFSYTILVPSSSVHVHCALFLVYVLV